MRSYWNITSSKLWVFFAVQLLDNGWIVDMWQESYWSQISYHVRWYHLNPATPRRNAHVSDDNLHDTLIPVQSCHLSASVCLNTHNPLRGAVDSLQAGLVDCDWQVELSTCDCLWTSGQPVEWWTMIGDLGLLNSLCEACRFDQWGGRTWRWWWWYSMGGYCTFKTSSCSDDGG